MTQLWYEAKDEDGNIFYYHIKTSESRFQTLIKVSWKLENVEIHYRWDPPRWGYLSIEEQEQIEAQQRMKEYSKEKVFGEWDQLLN